MEHAQSESVELQSFMISFKDKLILLCKKLL